jgi:hypothetical protein
MSSAPPITQESATAMPPPKPPRNTLSRTAWAWIISSAILLGFSIYAAFNWFEIVDDEQWIGVRGEALTNPYLALERFLVERNVPLEKISRTKGIDAATTDPASRDAVMLLGDRRLAKMSRARVDAITAWVQAGGHLIVEAEQPELDDPVLLQWHVDRRRLVYRNGKYIERPRVRQENEDELFGDEPSGDETTTEEKDEKNADDAKEPKPRADPQRNQSKPSVEVRPQRGNMRQRGFMDFSVGPDDTPSIVSTQNADGTLSIFEVHFAPYQNLKPLPLGSGSKGKRDLISDHHGGRIVEIQQGKGRVTIISNFDFLVRKQLAEADHAEFIWDLITGDRASPPVVKMALRNENSGLGAWLYQNAWMALIAGVTLLLLWIWRVLPRFGPLAASPSLARRSIREHLHAAGRFLAKHTEWDALVSPARQRLLTQLTRQMPRLGAMDMRTQVETIARALEITDEEVARTLFVKAASRRDAFYALAGIIKLQRRLHEVSRINLRRS